MYNLYSWTYAQDEYSASLYMLLQRTKDKEHCKLI